MFVKYSKSSPRTGKWKEKIELKPSPAFEEIANRTKTDCCAPERGIPRTWDKILDTLAALNSRDELPDLSALAGFQHRKDAADPVKDGLDDGSALAA